MGITGAGRSQPYGPIIRQFRRLFGFRYIVRALRPYVPQERLRPVSDFSRRTIRQQSASRRQIVLSPLRRPVLRTRSSRIGCLPYRRSRWRRVGMARPVLNITDAGPSPARSYLIASNTANPTTTNTATQIVAAVASKRPASQYPAAVARLVAGCGGGDAILTCFAPACRLASVRDSG